MIPEMPLKDLLMTPIVTHVLPFIPLQIVNRSDVGGSAGASASSSSATSRHRTSRHSTASIFSRNSVSSSSRYTASSSMRRASRVAENISGGVPSGSLLPNISKLKERVAQGGSKVMASFKSDSATSSGPSRSHPGVASAMAASAVAAVAATAAATAASARAASSSSSSSAFGDKSASTRARSASIDRKNTSSGCSSSSKSKVPSQSSLTNEQLTAHLTDEERSILEKVFLKEEEFHRESVFKRCERFYLAQEPLPVPLHRQPVCTDAQVSMLLARCIPTCGCCMLDATCWMLNCDFSMLNAAYGILEKVGELNVSGIFPLLSFLSLSLLFLSSFSSVLALSLVLSYILAPSVAGVLLPPHPNHLSAAASDPSTFYSLPSISSGYFYAPLQFNCPNFPSSPRCGCNCLGEGLKWPLVRSTLSPWQ